MPLPDIDRADIDSDRRPDDRAALLWVGIFLLPISALLIYLAAHVALWLARSLP